MTYLNEKEINLIFQGLSKNIFQNESDKKFLNIK